jgi:hypothetical protein
MSWYSGTNGDKSLDEPLNYFRKELKMDQEPLKHDNVDKFFMKFINLDEKTMKVYVLLILPYAALYFLVLRPWLITVGGPFGAILAALAVPVGLFLLILIVGLISRIFRKNQND